MLASFFILNGAEGTVVKNKERSKAYCIEMQGGMISEK